ncbi:MAG: hypothetical protein GYA69_00815 [Candidatus Moranbacteria bacterium]|nr:hypothetical protein [Candidatus Moranbacteria bacterium]
MREHEILTREEARKMIDEIMEGEYAVTDYEETFLLDMYNSVNRYLTVKQTALLWKIYTKIQMNMNKIKVGAKIKVSN